MTGSFNHLTGFRGHCQHQFQNGHRQQHTQMHHGQANHHSSASQPKSLPCKKMICTGVCTYRNRCHYIHDARIMTPATKGICRKKNKDENNEQKDLFYWTPMTTIPGKETRSYSVPQGSTSPGGAAVASLWHYFVEVCVATSSLAEPDDGATATNMNPVTGRPRLAVFVELAGQTGQTRSRSPVNYLSTPLSSSGRLSPGSYRRSPPTLNDTSNNFQSYGRHVEVMKSSTEAFSSKIRDRDFRQLSPTSVSMRRSLSPPQRLDHKLQYQEAPQWTYYY